MEEGRDGVGVILPYHPSLFSRNIAAIVFLILAVVPAFSQTPVCVRTAEDGTVRAVPGLERLKGELPRLEQMAREVTYLREMRRVLDQTNAEPQPEHYQQYAAAITSYAANLVPLIDVLRADIEAAPNTWEYREHLDARLKLAVKLLSCTSFETHWRFQNEPSTRAAKDRIKAAWAPYSDAALAAAGDLYDRAGIARRVTSARSDAELDLIRGEVGTLMHQGVVRNHFFGVGAATRKSRFGEELPALISKRKRQFQNSAADQQHEGADRSAALAAFRGGRVPGWSATDDGTRFVTITRLGGDGAKVQTELRCNRLHDIPTITMTATIDPKAKLRWRKPTQSVGGAFVSVGGRDVRASQPYRRDTISDPNRVNRLARQTTVTVNVFSVHFVDDNAGRRALDAHIRKYGAGGKRHPAETKLYKPAHGYGTRGVDMPFRLFKNFQKLNEYYERPHVPIGGQVGGGTKYTSFIDIGGKDGPLSMAARACFGGVSPEFKDAF